MAITVPWGDEALPVRKDPKIIIIYGPPKCGKTEQTVKLPKSLIIDLEKGADVHEGAKYIHPENLNDLTEVYKDLRENKKMGNVWDFLVIDTIDKLVEWCESKVVVNYNSEQKKLQQLKPDKAHEYPLIKVYSEIAYGKGHDMVRNEVRNVLSAFKEMCGISLIVVAHLKRTLIGETKIEVNETDIELPGRLKSMLTADADGTALCTPIARHIMELNFCTSSTSIAGSRMAHLAGKKFILGDERAPHTWADIFPSLREKYPDKYPVKIEEPVAEKEPVRTDF